jgi:Tfp pilus assembly protein PilE
MSITLIVIISTAMAALIGLKIYFEYSQEKQLEKAKEEFEQQAKAVEDFTQEEAIAVQQPVEEQPKSTTSNLVIVDIESVNSITAEAEVKPKKNKKRFYGKRKPNQAKAKKTNNN